MVSRRDIGAAISMPIAALFAPMAPAGLAAAVESSSSRHTTSPPDPMMVLQEYGAYRSEPMCGLDVGAPIDQAEIDLNADGGQWQRGAQPLDAFDGPV
jgi:hypothetical protein